MSREIVLRLDGVTATARLNDERAPATCARVWDGLPIEATAHNLRWGGRALWLHVRSLATHDYEFEDRVTAYERGMLAFRPHAAEIVVAYGPAQARDGKQTADWATPFARLAENAEAFLAAAERLRHTGAKPFVIERKG